MPYWYSRGAGNHFVYVLSPKVGIFSDQFSSVFILSVCSLTFRETTQLRNAGHINAHPQLTVKKSGVVNSQRLGYIRLVGAVYFATCL